MSETGSFSHLVVVGSSAGGIEALSELVSTLPGDLPVPIVIAQHLDPERESNLQEILSRRSPLPVRTVVDADHLQEGVVYVVPANHHVNISDAHIGLQEDSAGRPKPSVDLLMSSAAGAFGERLIAVVLTGTGSDGTEGARVVKGAGGTVVIQDPDTAAFGGMPGSLAPNTVDIVAPLDRIGPLLGDLVTGVEVAEGRVEAEERRELERFLEQLRERHGIDFGSYKTPTIMRRLKRRMAATGVRSIPEYSRFVEENPEEYRHVINAFLIKVTEFFRDGELFEYLKTEVLPELISEAREKGEQLRIWSAGCATGEEAYSLAILLSDLLGEEAGRFDARIFATDVDEDAVNFARHGVYPASALSNLSAEQVERYFVSEDGQYHVRKPVRGMIVFGEHDLARRSPFPRIDLVSSRNVLIYFTPELQRRVLQLFAYSLRDNGFLVLGNSETTSPLPGFFEPVHRQHRVYRRQGERFLIPPSVPVSPAPVPRQKPRRGGDLGVESGSYARSRGDGGRPARVAGEDFLNRLPVGVVVVDRRYDIQAINTTARELLSIPGVAEGEDFLHLLGDDSSYAEVRRAIDAALRNGHGTRTSEIVVEDGATGEPGYLRLSCHPQRAEEGRGPAEAVMIVVHDVTEEATARRDLEKRLEEVRDELEAVRREAEAEAARHGEQSERLIETNRRLEEANRELNALNGELRSNNEEAMLSTEEAQAATEEVETLNEELQATNEELETLNEELQATIEELNTTNEDLQARSGELRELARTREDERRAAEAARRRLEAILGGMGDAVLAVDAEGRVLFSNEVFRETFGDGEAGDLETSRKLGDLMPLDESGEELAPEATPQARAAEGEAFEMRFAVAGGDGALLRFDSRGRPIDGGGGVILLRPVPEDAS